jgi:hypothetical protein
MALNQKIKRRILAVMLCFSLYTGAFGAPQSFLGKYVGKWINDIFPNIHEVSWIANAVSMWRIMVSFAETTLALADQFSESYKHLKATGEAIERTYKDIEKLCANFDPYDMDSWASSLNYAHEIIMYDCGGALRSWSAVNFVTASADYIFDLDSIFNYDYRHTKNKEFVTEYYSDTGMERTKRQLMGGFVSYAEFTNERIEQKINVYTAIISKKGATPEEILDARDKIEALRDVQRSMTDTIYNAVALEHEDILLKYMVEMVSYNLTNMQVMEAQIQEFEAAGDYLVGQFYNLKEGKADKQQKKSAEKVSVKESSKDTVDNPWIETEGGTKNEDKASWKVPVTDAGEVRPITEWGKKKAVSYQDIMHLQNGVDFVLLKQDILYRDIEMIKARSAAVLLAVEAYRRNKIEMERIKQINTMYSMERTGK